MQNKKEFKKLFYQDLNTEEYIYQAKDFYIVIVKEAMDKMPLKWLEEMLKREIFIINDKLDRLFKT